MLAEWLLRGVDYGKGSYKSVCGESPDEGSSRQKVRLVLRGGGVQ